MNARPHGGHIAELDGLRGIAVALVMLTHFCPNVGVFTQTARFAEIGWIGVDLFFVLSGFLITGILLREVSAPSYYRRFYVRRAFRIFPVYYAFLFLIFGFLWAWRGGVNLQRLRSEWGSPWWFVVYLANYESVAKGALPVFAALGPLWSLQIEEQFYLVFPWLVRRLQRKLPGLLLGVIAIAFLYRAVMLVVSPTNAAIQYVGTIARADALACGALVASLRASIPELDQNPWIRLAPVLLIPLVGMYLLTGPAASGAFVRTVGFSANATCFAALIWWVAASQGSSTTALLRLSVLRFLGKISYGAYIFQLPVQTALKVISHTPTGTMTRTPTESLLWTTSTLCVAWLSWRFFETPLMKWGHARFSS